MSTTQDIDGDLYVRAIELTCRSDKLRREMLWLRAMEKGDDEAARDLEGVDPELRSRVGDVRDRAALDPHSASEIYGAAQDERLEAVVAVVEREARRAGAS